MSDFKILENFFVNFEKSNNPGEKEILELGITQLVEENILEFLESEPGFFINFFESTLSCKTKHKLFNLIFGKSNFSKLSKFLLLVSEKYKIDSNILKNGKLVKFNFPVYYPDKGDGDLVEASVFILPKSSKAIDLAGCLQDNQLKIISEYLNKGFIFSANASIAYNSYMLSTAIAVELEFFPVDFTFTGGLTRGGDVLKPEFVEEKRTIAKEKGKFLISPKYFDSEFSKIVDFLKECNPVKIPIYISVMSESQETGYRNFNTLVNTCDFELNIYLDFLKMNNELFFTYPFLTEEEEKGQEWINLSQKIREKIKNIQQKISQKLKNNFLNEIEVNFIIAIRGPVAFAYCLGYFFRNNVPVSELAHFQRGSYTLIPSKLQTNSNCDILYKSQENEEFFFIEFTEGGGYLKSVKDFAKNHSLILCHITTMSHDQLNTQLFPCYAEKVVTLLKERASSEAFLAFAAPGPIGFLIGYNVGRFNFNILHLRRNNDYLIIPAEGFI